MTSGRLLAVFAHPDDESLLAGATLAACACSGASVKVLCATRGEEGPISSPELATRRTLGMVREAELNEAARVLGVAEVECLGYADGGLSDCDPADLQRDIAREIVRWRPDAVLTFGPEGLYQHADHVAVHRSTCDALDGLAADVSPPSLYYATWPVGWVDDLIAALATRGLPADLWGHHCDEFGAPADSITTTVDVRKFAVSKLAALRCHRTQFGPGHLVSIVPDDLAEGFFGTEFFVRARPELAEPEWLAALWRRYAPDPSYATVGRRVDRAAGLERMHDQTSGGSA